MADSSRRIQFPVPTARPRTHAERGAETRAEILRTVSESVVEVGFARTTAAEIPRRADVTWGAVQHHFGGKDGMPTAVLENREFGASRHPDILEEIRKRLRRPSVGQFLGG